MSDRQKLTDADILTSALQVLRSVAHMDNEDMDAVLSIARTLFSRMYMKELYAKQEAKR